MLVLPRFYRLRRSRRLLESHRDQTLYDIARVTEVNPQPPQQDEGQCKLDENDRGERQHALPRPDN